MRAALARCNTPPASALIAVLLIALAALLVGCADKPVTPRHDLDEAQQAFVFEYCAADELDAAVMRDDRGRMVIECAARVTPCAAP